LVGRFLVGAAPRARRPGRHALPISLWAPPAPGHTAEARALLQRVVAYHGSFDGKQQASDLLKNLGGSVN